MSADVVRIAAQLKASLLHYLKSVGILILRDNADMSCNNVRSELLGKVKNSL